MRATRGHRVSDGSVSSPLYSPPFRVYLFSLSFILICSLGLWQGSCKGVEDMRLSTNWDLTQKYSRRLFGSDRWQTLFYFVFSISGGIRLHEIIYHRLETPAIHGTLALQIHDKIGLLTPFMRASVYLMGRLPPSSFKPNAPNCHGKILLK